MEAEARRHAVWWAKPAGSMAVALMMMAKWHLARRDPTKPPLEFPAAFGLALLLGMFLVYVVPLLYRLDRPEVRVRGRGTRWPCGRWRASACQAFSC